MAGNTSMTPKTSLTYKNRQFLLSGQPFSILSGAIHYFRVVPEYWKDRLLKAKQCGLNTVETYAPWNLHEPIQGQFKSDGMLDVHKFISLAGELGLKVIFRPGPYICSEWDLGGLPAWLLADPDMKVRSNYEHYMVAADRYLKWVIGLVKDLQYSNGGPIIAVQIENEFGSYSNEVAHLEFIRQCLEDAGVKELLVTSDNPWGNNSSLYLPGVLPTANFQTKEEGQVVLDAIEKSDPDFPLMVMEFWSGWFDHWGSKHHRRSVELLEQSLKFSFERNASVNFYMFHGGTNFGFMAGANMTDSDNNMIYKPDVTSYDYDAPLSESGQLTSKYFKIQEMIKAHKIQNNHDAKPNHGKMLFGKESNKNTGKNTQVKTSFGKDESVVRLLKSRRDIVMEERMTWDSMIGCITKMTSSHKLDTMEMFTYGSQNNKQIQSYGYIVYRKIINPQFDFKNLQNKNSSDFDLVLPDYLNDRATILVDGKIVAVFYWKSESHTVSLKDCIMKINEDFNIQKRLKQIYKDDQEQSQGSDIKDRSQSSDIKEQSKGSDIQEQNQGSDIKEQSNGSNIEEQSKGSDSITFTLDIVVENLGRVNYTEKTSPDVLNTQRKGIRGVPTLGGIPLLDWTVFALDFEQPFLTALSESDQWSSIGFGNSPNDNISTNAEYALDDESIGKNDEDDKNDNDKDDDHSNDDNPCSKTTASAPALYRSQITLTSDECGDCFVKMDSRFTKGVVFVNGFNLGRYWNVGPQKTLYLPGPLLKGGRNDVIVFDEREQGRFISLELEPSLQ